MYNAIYTETFTDMRILLVSSKKTKHIIDGRLYYLWMENGDTSSFFLIIIHSVSHLGGQPRQAFWEATFLQKQTGQEEGDAFCKPMQNRANQSAIL